MSRIDYKKKFIRFIEKAACFDNYTKLKLLLFLSGEKPNTYVAVRIAPKNLRDKISFEKHLKELKIIFEVSKAKGFEEIEKIKKNIAVWKLKGIWFGYDLFSNKKSQQEFKEYKKLLKKQKHAEADRLGGKIYDYPKCCINEFIKEQNSKYLSKKYSYCNFYNKLHDNDKKFPFLQQTPCKTNCNISAQMNKKYERAVKKISPEFYKNFTKTKTYKTDIIIDNINDVADKKGKSIWPNKKCYDYIVITKSKINSRHYLISWFSKKFYDEGAVLSSEIKMKCNYAEIKAGKIKEKLNGFIHERHFTKI